MESGDSGSTGSSISKKSHQDEHVHFNEEDVKGHEEGHVIHEAETHFVVRPGNFQKGTTQDIEEDADPEVTKHLHEAKLNSEENKSHQASGAQGESGEQGQ